MAFAIEQLRSEIKAASDATLAVRQAMNPKAPEEVLTIARLSDRIENLTTRLEDFESDQTERYRSFTESVIREIEASNNATRLIIVALVPLVLNLGYTIWKDRRETEGKQRGKDSSKTEEG